MTEKLGKSKAGGGLVGEARMECWWQEKIACEVKTSSEVKQQQQPTSQKAPGGSSHKYHRWEFCRVIGY